MAHLGSVQADLLVTIAGGPPAKLGEFEIPLETVESIPVTGEGAITIPGGQVRQNLAAAFRAAADELDPFHSYRKDTLTAESLPSEPQDAVADAFHDDAYPEK